MVTIPSAFMMPLNGAIALSYLPCSTMRRDFF